MPRTALPRDGQRLFHPHAVARRGDLARVGRAHRRDRVGVQDAVLSALMPPALRSSWCSR